MNSFRIYTVLLMVTLISSCDNKVLDKLPDNRLSKEEAFSDPQMVARMVNRIYAGVPSFMHSYWFFQMLASATDEAVDANPQFTAAEWNRGLLSVGYDPIEIHDSRLNMWEHYWRAIRRANVFLESIDLAPINDSGASNSITSVQRDLWIAEVKVLRAFFYLELMKYYGGVYLTDKPFPTDFDFNSINRNSFDECTQWIVSQCDEAMGLLPVRRKQGGAVDVSGIGKMSKMIALAIKARALLYNASPLHNPDNDLSKWRAAAVAAKAVLDLAEQSGEYRLYYSQTPSDGARNTYDLFLQPDNGTAEMAEVIWQGAGNRAQFTAVNAIRSANGNRAGTCPTQEFVDAFETISGHPPILGYADDNHLSPILNPEASDYDETNPYENRDPRLTGYVYYNGSYWGKKGTVDYYVQTYRGGLDEIAAGIAFTKTGYYIRKFTDPTRGNGTVSNASPAGRAYWPIFRLAEFYLSFAEASNEADGPNVEAIEAVNAIRNRAGMPDIRSEYTVDQATFRERIRNERRVELAFEEHRFFDVRRWKILNQTDRVVTGMLIESGNGGVFEYNRFVVENRLAFENKYLLFPIPLNETNSMRNHGQNPDW